METTATVDINSVPEENTIPKESCCEETDTKLEAASSTTYDDKQQSESKEATSSTNDDKQQSESKEATSSTNDDKQQSESKEKSSNPNVTIKSVSYSKTVEYKDGKRIETRKGVKRVNDNWFTLTPDEKWEPTTKDQAITASHVSTKAIENGKETKQVCKGCEREADDSSENLLGLLLLGTVLRPMVSRFSFLDLI